MKTLWAGKHVTADSVSIPLFSQKLLCFEMYVQHFRLSCVDGIRSGFNTSEFSNVPVPNRNVIYKYVKKKVFKQQVHSRLQESVGEARYKLQSRTTFLGNRRYLSGECPGVA